VSTKKSPESHRLADFDYASHFHDRGFLLPLCETGGCLPPQVNSLSFHLAQKRSVRPTLPVPLNTSTTDSKEPLEFTGVGIPKKKGPLAETVENSFPVCGSTKPVIVPVSVPTPFH
jgi:hypothetical protein